MSKNRSCRIKNSLMTSAALFMGQLGLTHGLEVNLAYGSAYELNTSPTGKTEPGGINVESSAVLRFVDTCTHEETATSSPNGVSIEARISGLSPDLPVWVDFKMGPSNWIDAPQSQWVQQKTKTKNPTKISPNEGVLEFKKKVKFSFPKDESPDQLRRKVWTARLKWAQFGGGAHPVGKTGAVETSLLMLSSDEEKFYAAESNIPICEWHSSVQIQSEYIFNPQKNNMTLTRNWHWGESEKKQKQKNLGLVNLGGQGTYFYPGGNNYTGVVPLVGNFANTFVWFFRDWTSLSGNSNWKTFSRNWTLNEEQGGFYGVRYHFSRLPVQEYRLKKGGFNSCAKWVSTRRGYLDIGRPQLDFHIVPKSLAGDRETSIKFMDKMDPQPNTCDSRQAPFGGVGFEIPQAGEGLMYFYPNESKE